jgi:transcriptional regulator with XRE-family HTH domain
MDVATLVSTTRARAGLSQRQLAQRARTSAAAVCQYERGERVPRVDTLERLIAAAGETLALGTTGRAPIDVERNALDLVAVLELADALPQQHHRDLRFPPLRTALARR